MIRNDEILPRLSAGAGPADGSKMCVMQYVSYENGDSRITDFPECVHPEVARLMQGINDRLGREHDSVEGFLSASATVQILKLSDLAKGTNSIPVEVLAEWVEWVLIDNKHGVAPDLTWVREVASRFRRLVPTPANVLYTITPNGPTSRRESTIREQIFNFQLQRDSSLYFGFAIADIALDVMKNDFGLFNWLTVILKKLREMAELDKPVGGPIAAGAIESIAPDNSYVIPASVAAKHDSLLGEINRGVAVV